MSEVATCIVIGAAGGIGSDLSAMLAEDGWNLVLCGRNREPLEQLASQIGSSVAGIEQVDAQDFAAVDEVFSKYDQVGGAVNLAGSILLKPSHSTSFDDYTHTMDQNIRTAFSVTRAAAKKMRKTGGSVVLMSSCAAQIGLTNHEAISAAKAAVEGLTRSAASTYASCNLRFNAIAPGLTETPMSSRLTSNDASRKASESMHPMGRIGQSQEIARAARFLLDPHNSWITGQTIGVDGGMAKVKGR
ncbi:MAG: SDR family NAD(P)-dependent oxidoreductase [Phycisphaerales bacterium]